MAAAAAAAAANQDKFSTILGGGTYGIVMYPALMDVAEDRTTPIKHPFMATKLFFTKADYDDAFAQYNALRAKIPHIMYKMIPYTRIFTTNEFLKNAQFMKIYKENFFGDKELSKMGYYLYAAAIPYLGSDLHRVATDPSRIARFLRIPEKEIVREIYNLFYKVKEIRDAGLMHSDIKIDNIVFNFGTKKFNLIDTDSITTWDKFLADSGSKIGTYYPPEFYIVKAEPEALERAYRGGDRLIVIRNLEGYTSGYYGMLTADDDMFKNLPVHLKSELGRGWIGPRLAEELYRIKQDDARIGVKTVAAKFDMIEKICKDGFDSYCLSLALFEFFNHIRRVAPSKNYEYLTNTILAGGISRYFYSKRSNLDTILLELKQYIQSEYGLRVYPLLKRSKSRSASRSGSGSGSGKTRRSKSRSPSLPKYPSKG